MKKILFIGDFSPARNYGSIATSEAMKHLLSGAIGEGQMRIIDVRSYYSNTPINGYPQYILSFKRFSSGREWFRSIIPPGIRKIKKIVKPPSKNFNPHVPFKFSLYEEYYRKVSNDKILQYEKESLKWADIVICSGEGTLVHGLDSEGRYLIGGLYHLYMLWLAKVKFNKPTLVVNHTVDTGNNEANEIISYLYPKLDFVAVRERLSLKTLEKLNVNNAKFIPDALFSYKPKGEWYPSLELVEQIDFSKPYICLGDTSGIIANAYNSSVKWDILKIYSEIIVKLKEVIPQIVFVDGFRGINKEVNSVIKMNKIGCINLKNCSYKDLYHVLQGSELFISGRWHASILSVMAGTPIVLLGADSHKTKALYDILDFKGDFFEIKTLPIYIDELIESVRKTLRNRDKISSHFKIKSSEMHEQAEENVAFLKKLLSDERG